MQYQSLTLLIAALAAHTSASVMKRDLGPAASLPGGWSYAGCYTDSVAARSLDAATYTDPTGMCEGTCISFCSSRGYTFAGVEYGVECWCGFGLKSSSTQDSDSQCDMACNPFPDETCGGRDHLAVFTNGAAGASNKPTVDDYSYAGCYTDSGSSRGLSHPMHTGQTSSTMTVETCVSTCKAAGYSYAGTEFGGECFCDNTLASTSTLVEGSAVDSGCDMLCNGDSTEWCGGKGRLTVYVSSED